MTVSAAESCRRYREHHPKRVRAQRERYYWATKKRYPEHNVWRAMLYRCSCISDPLYGGRGIKVCARWRRSFANFLADMGRRPSPAHSLDRYPDQDGDYKLTNCRWATSRQQTRNKRTNRILSIGGRKQPLCDWAEEAGILTDTIEWRLRKGWRPQQAVFQPVHR